MFSAGHKNKLGDILDIESFIQAELSKPNPTTLQTLRDDGFPVVIPESNNRKNASLDVNTTSSSNSLKHSNNSNLNHPNTNCTNDINCSTPVSSYSPSSTPFSDSCLSPVSPSSSMFHQFTKALADSSARNSMQQSHSQQIALDPSEMSTIKIRQFMDFFEKSPSRTEVLSVLKRKTDIDTETPEKAAEKRVHHIVCAYYDDDLSGDFEPHEILKVQELISNFETCNIKDNKKTARRRLSFGSNSNEGEKQ